ncbi:hypothetical protein Tco_0863476 [Tanacetum coccineum]
MLSRRLEVDHQSEMGYELIRFARSGWDQHNAISNKVSSPSTSCFLIPDLVTLASDLILLPEEALVAKFSYESKYFLFKWRIYKLMSKKCLTHLKHIYESIQIKRISLCVQLESDGMLMVRGSSPEFMHVDSRDTNNDQESWIKRSERKNIQSNLKGGFFRLECGAQSMLGLKDFKMILRVTTAQLQLLSDYYCWKVAERKNELKAKSTLLLAIPDEHLLKFHGIKDAKTLRGKQSKDQVWGNKESRKLQKGPHNLKASILWILLHQDLKDWIKPMIVDLDTLSMGDLYNNLKVYESEIKVQSSSSSNSQNVAFVSSENTSSTNEVVNTAHEVSTASSQGQASSLTYADDVMFSFFANQSNITQLDNEDLEQINTDDLEEWQVAIITTQEFSSNAKPILL